LSIFEDIEFLSGVDAHVRIRTDAEPPLSHNKLFRREEAISQIGLGDWAKSNDGTSSCDSLQFAVINMSGMH
jgi:hypothetical protein